MKIVILDTTPLDQFGIDWSAYDALGQVERYERTAPEDVIERCQGAEVVCSNKVILDKERLEALPDLKFIQIMATGTNIVDFDVARERGLKVSNIPSYSTASVVQQTFAMLLHLVRDVAGHDASVKEGDWVKSPSFSYFIQPMADLEGMHMGLVGQGEIGEATAQVARAFGMKVSFARIPGRPVNEAKVELDDLLPQLDVLSLHCPLTDLTKDLLNETRCRLLPAHAYVLNTSRGPVINEADLAKVLHEGHLAGVGLDVLSVEPPSSNNPMLSAPRTVINPHIGWGSTVARQRLVGIMVKNLKAYQSGEGINLV